MGHQSSDSHRVIDDSESCVAQMECIYEESQLSADYSWVGFSSTQERDRSAVSIGWLCYILVIVVNVDRVPPKCYMRKVPQLK